MSEKVNKSGISDAFESVRNESGVQWACFEYDDSNNVTIVETGGDYSEFEDKCREDNRLYGFIKFNTGDEMSKREKFVFVTWIGKSVPPLKKAMVSTDKAFVKKLVHTFAVEVCGSEKDEISQKVIMSQLIKAGGANYGTGGSR